MAAGLGRREACRYLLPVGGVEGQSGVSQQLQGLTVGLMLHERHTQLAAAGADDAHEGREVVALAGTNTDAVEAVVLQAEARPASVIIVVAHALGVEAHICGVVLVQGCIHA